MTAAVSAGGPAPAAGPARKSRAPRRAAAKPPSTLTGYILHQHDWSESSLVIDAFTRELGRVVLVARGAKRPYSQLRPVLLPFQRLQLVIGRSAASGEPGAEPTPELHNLRAAEWIGTHPQPRGAALFSGFYLHELLRALLARQDPHPVLFDAYAEAVAWLAGSDEALHAAVLRAFECRLLREIGLLPALDVDTISAEPLDARAAYALSADLGVTHATGGLAAPAPGTLPGARLLAVEQALARPGLSALVVACQDGDADLKPALRQVLHYHLGAIPLRTRALLRELQSLMPRALAAPQPPTAEPTDA